MLHSNGNGTTIECWTLWTGLNYQTALLWQIGRPISLRMTDQPEELSITTQSKKVAIFKRLSLSTRRCISCLTPTQIGSWLSRAPCLFQAPIGSPTSSHNAFIMATLVCEAGAPKVKNHQLVADPTLPLFVPLPINNG